MKEIAIAYFVKDSIINISEIYLNMKHKFGELLPSYDVLNRFYKDWKEKIHFYMSLQKAQIVQKISICLLLEMLVKKQNIKKSLLGT